MAKLTEKQQRFVDEYMIDLNATQAAIRAGYSVKTANEQGSQNLAKLSIQQAIAEQMAERSKRTGINQDTDAFIDYRQMVLQELRKVTGQEQEVLMQKYIMYRSNYEISQVLNIHKSTVKRKLKSGIQTLLDK